MTNTQPAGAAEPPRRVVGAWAGTLVALVVATLPLWTPLRDVPRIAPAVWLATPAAFDWPLLMITIIGALAVLRSPRRRAIAWTVVALAWLMIGDQLRWQPWAWHGLVAGVVLAASRPSGAVVSLRWLTVAVYAFSAVAKLDATFAQTLGSQMIGALLVPLSVSVDSLDPSLRVVLALSLPVGEMLVAALLAVSLWRRRLRPWACGAAIAMHAATIGLLGPWALGHSLGVLVWNAGFAWQTFTLFTQHDFDSTEGGAPTTLIERAARGLALAATCVPAAYVVGMGDAWPSWALYAPAGERATLYVHNEGVERLPESLARHVDTDPGSSWRRVRLDRWVLSSTWAPTYPQYRIVAAVADGLANRYALSDRVRVVAETRATRLRGECGSETLAGKAALVDASRLFGVRPSVVWTR